MRIGDVDGTPASPDGGAITFVGGSSGFVEVNGVGGFDIEARTGAGYVVSVRDDTVYLFSSLYKMDLTTGAATLVGNVGAGIPNIVAMAIAPPSDILSASPDGKIFDYRDVDGDLVTVTRTGGAGDLLVPTFAPSEFGSQLLTLRVAADLRTVGASSRSPPRRWAGRATASRMSATSMRSAPTSAK